MDESLPQTTPLTAAQQMWPFTITHFILIALFALFAVYVIWRGRRLKRRRREAEAELLETGHGFRVESDEADAADPAVAPAAQPAEISPATSTVPGMAEPTDLTILKGVGPRVAARLAEQGVGSLSILAGLTAERAAAVDAQLGNFAGRMARDKWVEQARLIVSGDLTEYERQFGKLDRKSTTDAPREGDA